MIGGRLYHVLTDWSTYFGPGGAGLMAAFKIQEGGLGIWGAVALGGVGDIAKEIGVPQICGPKTLPALIGQPSSARPDVYSDTAPARLVSSGVETVMITGAEDQLAPPAHARTYVDLVKAAGGRAELVIVPRAGHWDVVTLATPAWRLISARIGAVLEKRAAQGR